MRTAEGGALTRGLRAAGNFLLRVPWPLSLVLILSWGFLIWDLSSHSVPRPERPILYWELLSNLAHAPLFGILTLFLAGLLLRQPGGGWPDERLARHALVCALVVAYGVLDEWHQSRIPGRDASPLDVLTDGVSALVVLWIVRTLGQPGAGERRLLVRLGVGLLLCISSAGLASLG